MEEWLKRKEQLPSKCKALSSISRITHKTKKKKEKKRKNFV
jgi:hypothetical protein